MTQKGKCDVCRRRKIKCDEVRPSCGQCRIKHRPCGYQYASSSRFPVGQFDVTGASEANLAFSHQGQDPGFDKSRYNPTTHVFTLTVRSVKEVKSGQGVFHTFDTMSKQARRIRARNVKPVNRARRSGMIPRPLVSREMHLCAKLTAALGEAGLKWSTTFLWASWLSALPARLGRNVALDDAVECLIAGTEVINDDLKCIVADREYTRALASLQTALYSDDEVRYSTETLAAVNILLLYDEILAFRELRWQAHCRGLVQLHFARGPQLKSDDMSRSLFYAALEQDFSEAVRTGQYSAFDSPEWLDFPAPENPPNEWEEFTTSSHEIARQMIQLPRLIVLVRRVRERPFDIDVCNEAVDLAEHLYWSYCELIAPYFEAVFQDQRAEWVDTIDQDVAQYFPKSLTFDSGNTFEGFCRYLNVRLLVLSLCMTLRVIVPLSAALEAADLEIEEEYCAMLIAASVQYAELYEPVSMAALIIRTPLLVSYGVWWKKLKQLGQDSPWEREKAAFMEHWCYERSNELIKVLNGDAITKSKLQAIYMMTAEGAPWEKCETSGPII